MRDVRDQLRLHALALDLLLDRRAESSLDLIQLFFIALKDSKITLKGIVKLPLRDRVRRLQQIPVSPLYPGDVPPQGEIERDRINEDEKNAKSP